MMTKLDQVRDRYRHDTMFHTYVDMMRKCIVDLHLTPGELRDAAMLAALIELERAPTEWTVRPDTEQFEEWRRAQSEPATPKSEG